MFKKLGQMFRGESDKASLIEFINQNFRIGEEVNAFPGGKGGYRLAAINVYEDMVKVEQINGNDRRPIDLQSFKDMNPEGSRLIEAQPATPDEQPEFAREEVAPQGQVHSPDMINQTREFQVDDEVKVKKRDSGFAQPGWTIAKIVDEKALVYIRFGEGFQDKWVTLDDLNSWQSLPEPEYGDATPEQKEAMDFFGIDINTEKSVIKAKLRDYIQRHHPDHEDGDDELRQAAANRNAQKINQQREIIYKKFNL